MADENINYYILFQTYTQGMQLREYLLEAKVPVRVAPAPRAVQGELGCGMSLLVQKEDIEAARRVIEEKKAPHHAIVALPCQINPNRLTFC